MIDIDFAGGVEINANTPKYNIKAIYRYWKVDWRRFETIYGRLYERKSS